MPLERGYQAYIIKEIKYRFPDAVVLKNDSGYMQGVPDLAIFNGPYWAMLEVKRSEHEPSRPNQEYWVALFDSMSFARFIYPENEEQVLRDLQLALSPRRRPRVSQSF